jgi:hypothetical protein
MTGIVTPFLVHQHGTTVFLNSMPLKPRSSSSSSSSSSILVGMAVIGKSNEPLYLCDCEKIVHDPNEKPSDKEEAGDDHPVELDEDKDPFGFKHYWSHRTEQRNSLPFSGQLLVHAALDNLEELLERPGGGGGGGGKHGPMPVIRKSSIVPDVSINSPPHWLGLLLHSSSDGHSVYGYITATNIKLMAITKDIPASESSNSIAIKLIQNFLQEVHQHFIAYLLNPFCDTRGGSLVSKQLDRRIAHSIANLRQSTIIVD